MSSEISFMGCDQHDPTHATHTHFFFLGMVAWETVREGGLEMEAGGSVGLSRARMGSKQKVTLETKS